MKWFKHFSQAKMDTKLVMLRSEFGMWGVGVYWTLLEFIAEQMKGVDPQPVATLSVRELCSFLGCKRNKLETFLKRLQNVRGMNYTLKKDILIIECRKLLEIKDNYHKDLEDTSPRLPSKEGEVDIEREVEQKQKIAEPQPQQDFGWLDQHLLASWGKDGRIGFAVKEEFVKLGKLCGHDRLRYAISEAAAHNAKNLAYVKAILQPKEQKVESKEEKEQRLRKEYGLE